MRPSSDLFSPHQKVRRYRIGGFSLIELSIVLMLGGVMFAGAATAAKQYIQRDRVVKTKKSFDMVTAGLEKYFGEYGRYPCPASFTSNDGVAAACDGSLPLGCANGICVVERANVDIDGPGTQPARTMRIVIGAVPFRQLNEGTDAGGGSFYEFPYPISSSNVIDPFGGKLLYAVTEQQTQANRYLEFGGAIQITDEAAPARIINDNANFVLASLGPNHKGAYTAQGTPFSAACNGQGYDIENCDMDAVFVDALKSDVAGASYYDDTISYTTNFEYNLWETSSADQTNIHNLNTGNVGVNVFDPSEKLHVRTGDVRAIGLQDGTNGFARSQQVCDNNGGNCMSADLIGGDALPKCPDGQAMRAIGNGAPQCMPTAPGANETCSYNMFLGGFTFNSATRTMTATCKGIRCETPWGDVISHSASVPAYKDEDTAAGCVPQTRVCTVDGLSGTPEYFRKDPIMPRCASCALPWGGSIGAYAQTQAYRQGSCSGTTIQCRDGTLRYMDMSPLDESVHNLGSPPMPYCGTCEAYGQNFGPGSSYDYYRYQPDCNVTRFHCAYNPDGMSAPVRTEDAPFAHIQGNCKPPTCINPFNGSEMAIGATDTRETGTGLPTCIRETATCGAGDVNGNAPITSSVSCAPPPPPPADCGVNGGVIPHNGCAASCSSPALGYFNGNTCCNNGVLTGSGHSTIGFACTD